MIPPDDIDILIKQKRQLSHECDSIFLNVEKQELSYWKQRAGNIVDIIWDNRKEAELCLNHPNPEVRCAALAILMNKWNAGAESHIKIKCEEIGVKDPNYEVRSEALIHLGSCYQNSGDLRIGKTLRAFGINEVM